jgi:hypothetical protein
VQQPLAGAAGQHPADGPGVGRADDEHRGAFGRCKVVQRMRRRWVGHDADLRAVVRNSLEPIAHLARDLLGVLGKGASILGVCGAARDVGIRERVGDDHVRAGCVGDLASEDDRVFGSLGVVDADHDGAHGASFSGLTRT